MRDKVLRGRRLLFVFLGLWLCLGGSLRALAAEDSFSAIICADLHFTLRRAPSSIVSGVEYCEEIAQAIVNEVIDQKPDVFILLGDNTNSGSETDVEVLLEKLWRVKQAGIQVVAITGNHDLDRATPEMFEEAYMPLCTPLERDESSLSYVAQAGEVVLLAMDDNSYTKGQGGLFSLDTIRWLGRMLEKYQGRPLLFLSHHNVLLGQGAEHSESYRIQNDDLGRVLEYFGVSLCLTGHLHSQNIVEEGGMYEVVSGMPLSSPHYLGFLTMEGGRGEYRAEPIDFASYGEEGFAQVMATKDQEAGRAQMESMAGTIAKSSYSEEEQGEILGVLGRFLTYYGQGTLGAHVEEIRQDPACEKMIDALWDYNYGPWILSTLEGKPRVANELSFHYGEDE